MSFAAVWLHFTFLTHAGGLWRDEITVLNLSRLSSLSSISKDSFPILMPLLLKLWCGLGLGGTDGTLRVLGFLIGLTLFGSLWLAGWVTHRQPPVLGLALLALNPTVIFYGDALRAYGLGTLLIVLVFAFAWRFLEHPTPRRAGWLALFVVLSVQTLFHNAVLVGAICVAAGIVCLRRKEWLAAAQVSGAGLAGAISLMPYVLNFAAMQESAAGMRIGFRPPMSWLNFRRAIAFPQQHYHYVWLALALAVLAAGCLAFFRKPEGRLPAASRSNDLPIFAATTLVVSVFGYVAFLWYTALPAQPWYFLPLLGVLAACLNAGIHSRKDCGQMALAVFAMATALVAFPLARQEVMCRYTNVDVLAAKLAREAAPGDFIVVAPWYTGITFERYFQGQTSWTTLPPLEEHLFHRVDLIKSKLGAADAIQPVLKRIAATLEAGHKVWFLGSFTMPSRGKPLPRDLAPPPLPVSGWAEFPYLTLWTEQAAGFAINHSHQFETVELTEIGSVNPDEDLRLAVASGWSPIDAPAGASLSTKLEKEQPPLP